MWFTRRDLLRAGLVLPLGVAGSEAAAAQAAADSVWTFDKGILTAVRRVQSDQCCVPRRTAPASGRSLTGTLRLNDGSLIGLVLNSDGARGPRYVVAIQRGRLRVYEIAWPGKNWAEWDAAVFFAKDHTLRMVLSPAGASTRLKILLDEKQQFERLLPARLDAFYQPAALVYDAVGSVSSLFVSQSVHGQQVVVPVSASKPRKREPTSRKERGQDAFGKWLEKSVTAVREKTAVPALACAVADASAVVAAAVAGVRNVGADTPVGLSDQFHIGTVTKAMTSTLLAMLIQDKRLTWATPLEQLLPDLAKSMHEAYRRMPLSFVAHEATGLEDKAVKGLDYGSKGGSLADLRTLWLQEALRQAPEFPPGTKHEYRNINYVIAGAIVDRLSGRETWESCIRTKLFAPLEITSAGYGPMGVPGEDLQPSGHTREKGVLRPVWGDVAPSMAPAGSLHMSVSDLARFAQLHLRGELGHASLLSAAAFRDLHKPLNGYGKGWAVGAPYGKGRYDFSHWGSNNLNTAEIIIRPGRGAAIAIATNESPFGEGHGGQAVAQLAILVLEQGLKLLKPKV